MSNSWFRGFLVLRGGIPMVAYLQGSVWLSDASEIGTFVFGAIAEPHVGGLNLRVQDPRCLLHTHKSPIDRWPT
jgi:hypothetical protein